MLSVIIPTYNMSSYLTILWASIRTSGLWDQTQEIIFVDDGSTDGTKNTIENLKKNPGGEKINLLSLPQNQGRFQARRLGAEQSNSELILFLDTRTNLPKNFAEGLKKAIPHNCAMATIFIDTNKSIYNLYWQRTHEFIFKKNYTDAAQGFSITKENYEEYVKGTGCFLVPKSTFLTACEKFKADGLMSDDTALMKEIVQTHPIWVHQDWCIEWEPRQNLKEFLARQWERGPGFAEYHLFERKGFYFKLTMFGLLIMAAWIYLLFTMTPTALSIAAIGLFLICVSSIFFSKGLKEFFMLLPLHLIFTLTSCAAVIRGIAVNLVKNKTQSKAVNS